MGWRIPKNGTAIPVAALLLLVACRSSLPGAPFVLRPADPPAPRPAPAPMAPAREPAPEPVTEAPPTESRLLLAVGEPEKPVAPEPVLPTPARDVSPPSLPRTTKPSRAAKGAAVPRPKPGAEPMCPRRGTAFAVVVPVKGDAGGTDATLRRHLDVVERLGGQFAFASPAVSGDDLDALRASDGDADAARPGESVPVVLRTDLWGGGRKGCAVLAENGAARVMALSASARGKPGGTRMLRSVLPRLGDLLRDRVTKALVLIVDTPLWETDAAMWRRVRGFVRTIDDVSLVAFSGSEEFYWSEIDGIRCFRVPTAVAEGGEFPGLLWGALTEDRVHLSVVRADGVVGLAQFRRDVQMKREQLRGSLHASAIADSRSITTVTCRNPTPGPLQFRAKWVFGDGADATVEPEVLGFRLGPGEVFTQDFKIQATGFPVKHLRPALVLSTELPGGTGEPVPLAMRAYPWCCVFGEVRPVNASPVLDGNPSEWGGPGFRINHASQVLLGGDSWGGPGDLSGHVFLGYDTGAVYLGAHVYDDSLVGTAGPDGVCRAEFYLDLRNPQDGGDTGLPGPGDLLKIVVAGDGSSAVLPAGDDVNVAVKLGEKGFSVEAVVEAGRFAGGELPRVVRMDAGLYDRSDPLRAGKVLFLSGTPEDAMRGELMGGFTRADAGP